MHWAFQPIRSARILTTPGRLAAVSRSWTQQRTAPVVLRMSFPRVLFSTHPEEKTATATSKATSYYAMVDHSLAYEKALSGQHGKQLALAELEGEGKDDPDFDPFIEEELEEDRLRQAGGQIEEGDMDEVEGETNIISEEGGNEEEEDIDDYNEDDEEDDFPSVYNNDGSLRRAKSELATLRAGAPSGGMIAIIELAGTQHKVTTDDLLIVNRLKPLDSFQVGSVHTFTDNVMLVSSSHWTMVGMPYVKGAQVDVMVEEITKDAKVIIFKKRRRKHSQRKNGFRRDVTMLRILDIRPPDKYQNLYYVARPPPTLPQNM